MHFTWNQISENERFFLSGFVCNHDTVCLILFIEWFLRIRLLDWNKLMKIP